LELLPRAEALCFLIIAFCLFLTRSAAPLAVRDQSFTSNGVQIRYVDQGTGDPVLLVHGYTRSIETNWIETGIVRELAKRHRVIAFDLRGHGKSGKPYDSAKYGREMVQDAIRLLDHLGIRRAHIVGYSLGAIITARILTTNPDRFLSATLGGHAGYRNWRPEFDQSAERFALELESEVPFRGLVIAMTPRDEPRRSEEDIRARSAALAAINDVKALAAYQRGGTREFNSTDEEVAAIKVPVLGIIGSLDNVQAMQGLKRILPSLELVAIDGATHTGDRGALGRAEFVGAVGRFIAAHPASSTSSR
jgi:pimeloyl-ACP methyl ester carboxylesterase